jgi:AmmeMemoRadiSam system protein B
MDQVLSSSRSLAEPRTEELRRESGWSDEPPLVAGICPHDDYMYAGRLYALLMPHIRAKTVIVFGVFHKARTFECRDRLVFDPSGPGAARTGR